MHALCPAIYGHEVVKAGLLLALAGGVRKNADSADRVPIRCARVALLAALISVMRSPTQCRRVRQLVV